MTPHAGGGSQGDLRTFHQPHRDGTAGILGISFFSDCFKLAALCGSFIRQKKSKTGTLKRNLCVEKKCVHRTNWPLSSS